MPVIRFKSQHLLPKPIPVMSVIHGTVQQLDNRPVVKISQPVQQPRHQALSCEVPEPKKRFSVVVKAGQGQVQSTSSISMDKLARKKEVDLAGVVGPVPMSGKKRPSQKSFNEPPAKAKKPNSSNQQPPPQRQQFSQQPHQHYSRGGPSQPQTHHHRAQNDYTQHQPHQQHHQHHQHQQQHHHASHPRQQTPVPEFNGQCHSNFRSIPLVDSAPPPADARPPPNTATGRIGLPVTSVNWNWNGSSSDQNDAKNKLDGCGALESDMRCYIKKAVEVTWLKNPLTSVKECRQFIEQNIENQKYKYNIAKVSKNSLRCQVHRTLNNLKTCGSIHKKRQGPRVKYGISVKNNILQLALNRKQQR